MPAKYQLVRNSDFQGDPEAERKLHARVVSNGTIHLTDLMHIGSGRSSFSPADIKGALQLISDLLREGLKNGYCVELDGIGFFSISLECREETNAKKIRSESIRFRNVNFRPSKAMKDSLKTMQLYREPTKRRQTFSEEERLLRLWKYLDQHSHVTTRDYMSFNSCTKYRALNELKDLVAHGVLRTIGPRNNTVYERCPDASYNTLVACEGCEDLVNS